MLPCVDRQEICVLICCDHNGRLHVYTADSKQFVQKIDLHMTTVAQLSGVIIRYVDNQFGAGLKHSALLLVRMLTGFFHNVIIFDIFSTLKFF